MRWALIAGITASLTVAAGCGGSGAPPSATTAPPATTAVPAQSTASAATATVSAVKLESLIAPGATVQTVAADLTFAEGPLWLPDGRLIVSDVPNNLVVAYDKAGVKHDFRPTSNSANGHAFDLDGSVLEAEAGTVKHGGGIARIAADGTATMLVDSYQGKRFDSPNDLAVKRDGTIWFTDPDYDKKVDSQIGFSGVYRFDPATKAVTLVTDKLFEPNGIAFSPDEKTLYVSGSQGLVWYSVAADGTVGPEHVSYDDSCDGMGVDEHGNIWATTCTRKVVTITDPAGLRVGEVDVPGIATNVAWGGADGKTLFITAQDGGVYSLALTVGEAH